MLQTRPQITELKQSYREALLKAIKTYGIIGFILHYTMAIIFQIIFYSIVKFGLDAGGILELIGIGSDKFWGRAGPYAIAFAINKAILPLRICLSIAALSALSKRGYLQKGEQ